MHFRQVVNNPQLEEKQFLSQLPLQVDPNSLKRNGLFYDDVTLSFIKKSYENLPDGVYDANHIRALLTQYNLPNDKLCYGILKISKKFYILNDSISPGAGDHEHIIYIPDDILLDKKQEAVPAPPESEKEKLRKALGKICSEAEIIKFQELLGEDKCNQLMQDVMDEEARHYRTEPGSILYYLQDTDSKKMLIAKARLDYIKEKTPEKKIAEAEKMRIGTSEMLVRTFRDGFFYQKGLVRTYHLMPYIPHQNLENFFRKTSNQSPQGFIEIMLNIAEGIRKIHQLGYGHFDLHPKNILINLYDHSTTLIDFETSKPIHPAPIENEAKGQLIYNTFYCDPELINLNTPAADIYSLAKIMRYYLLRITYLFPKATLHKFDGLFEKMFSKDPLTQCTLDECIRDLTELRNHNRQKAKIVALNLMEYSQLREGEQGKFRVQFYNHNVTIHIQDITSSWRFSHQSYLNAIRTFMLEGFKLTFENTFPCYYEHPVEMQEKNFQRNYSPALWGNSNRSNRAYDTQSNLGARTAPCLKK